MSIPSSIMAGPFASTVLVKKRYLSFYIFLIWISILSVLIEFWFYWQIFFFNFHVYFFVFLPFFIVFADLSLVFTSLIFAKFILTIVNVIHKPREGIFYRNSTDKDYRYWSIRNTIKRWPIWLSHKFPFPFLDNFCFKLFGVRTSFSNSLYEGWVDCEFVEFGKNVVIGQGSIIQSAAIVGNIVLIKKTVIGDNVSIGAHAVIMPGTRIGNNAIVAASSMTTVGQELEDGWIYLGVPAEKFKENRFFEDNLENKLTPAQDVEQLRKKYEQVYVKRYDSFLSFKEKKQIKKDKIAEEKRRKEKSIQKEGE